MRVGTLNDKETLAFLKKHFVLVTHNQLPELYCQSKTIDTTQVAYPQAQMDTVGEGVGGGNVRSLFCTADGRIVNYISGNWKREKYLKEAKWALSQIQKIESTQNDLSWWEAANVMDALRLAHHDLTGDLAKQRDSIATSEEMDELVKQFAESQFSGSTRLSVEESNRKVELFNRVAAFNRLIRSHTEVKEMLGKKAKEVLQKIEEEVYASGAIGCGS